MTDTEQTKVVDYEKENKRLNEAQNRPDYWKPEVGKYQLTAKTEITEFEYIDDEGKTVKRASLIIEADGKEYSWVMGIGLTKASAYGQLVDLASKNNNSLKAFSFTVVVKSDGKKRDYTIV